MKTEDKKTERKSIPVVRILDNGEMIEDRIEILTPAEFIESIMRN